MHDGCVAGYVCDSSNGQCVLANPGQGDTLDNCEASCSVDPPPADTYTCDVTTFTCVQSTNAYDQNSCDNACSDETPSALIGLWRGLDVQTGFQVVKKSNKHFLFASTPSRSILFCSLPCHIHVRLFCYIFEYIFFKCHMNVLLMKPYFKI
jgi:hypothetical protein